MINNLNLVEDETKRTALMHEIVDLFERVRAESDDTETVRMAIALEAYTYLALNEPHMTLALIEDLAKTPMRTYESIVVSAYQMTGEVDKAKEILQIGLYQHLIQTVGLFSQYIIVTIDDDDKFNETVKRARETATTYQLKTLHPTMLLNLELTIAIAYAMRKETDQCLKTLEVYARIVHDTPATYDLHGDLYLDRIQPWIEDLDNGTEPPRNTASIRNDLVDIVATHPAFADLQDEPRYQTIVSKLQRLKEN